MTLIKPPYVPPVVTCSRCRYHYEPKQMTAHDGSRFQCRDVDACQGRLAKRRRDQAEQRSWKK